MSSANVSPKFDGGRDGGNPSTDAWTQAPNRTAAMVRDQAPSTLRAQGKLLVLIGAKGGCGVTTVASNVAMALARESDRKVLLIDLALPIGDVALCLGIAAEYSTEDALRNSNRLDATLLQRYLCMHRSGIFVLAAPTKVSDLEVSNHAIDKLIAVARAGFDYVIVDMGSRVDEAAELLFQYASTVFLVTQTGVSELRNSNRLISQFFTEGAPSLEIVLNRVEPRFLDAANDEILTRALGMEVRWKIPDDQNAVRALQSGSMSSKDRFSRISAEMAGSIRRALPKEEKNDSPPVRSPRSAARAVPDNHELAREDLPLPDSCDPANIVWPALEPICYGEKLTFDQLNASTSVAGMFVYTPGPGYLLPVGTHTLWLTFTPAAAGQAPLQIANSIVVRKAAPVLSWRAPSRISAGTALDETHLNASASVPGRFDYSPAAGEVLPPGTHTISASFTPADESRYTTAQAAILLTVARETPAIEFPMPDPIVYGERLGAAQLRAAASIPGAFEYNPGAGALLAAGEHPLTAVFTPADLLSCSTAEATVLLSVAKAIPCIEWRPPDSMVQGAALSAAQLNATANIPGFFAYSPAAGELPAPGTHELSAVFTPADSLNYTTAHAVVPITVVEKLSPAISWPAPSAISYGTALTAAQLNAAASVPGRFTYAPSAGQILAPGRTILSAWFTPADTETYAAVRATVELEVEGPPLAASASCPEESAGARAGDSGAAATVNPRETRMYKGAVYERGDDGQWHLQKN